MKLSSRVPVYRGSYNTINGILEIVNKISLFNCNAGGKSFQKKTSKAIGKKNKGKI
jgi:hypothetical protein